MEFLLDPQIWISLVTLAVLEIVLGVDNLVFIAILSDRLPAHQRPAARRLGLAVALITRLMLLATLAWIVGLTQPVLTLFEQPISWRDIILIAGGIFLIAKSTHEIHGSLEGEEDHGSAAGKAAVGFVGVVVQIGIIDIVFSLDSVITAVGMVRELWVMVTAVVIAMIVMLAAANPLSDFVSRHPTVKMLALAFLLLIGTALIADGFGFHIPKGYIYAAMGFSVLVEALNLAARRRRRTAPVKLRSDL
ncbi:TerC family protein [Desertibaculum subflavum]|uniref:TerC family protein n=1 Tax=Desertibaculum subflavum TaxID=2268458 RepID=UPI000E669027